MVAKYKEGFCAKKIYKELTEKENDPRISYGAFLNYLTQPDHVEKLVDSALFSDSEKIQNLLFSGFHVAEATHDFDDDDVLIFEKEITDPNFVPPEFTRQATAIYTDYCKYVERMIENGEKIKALKKEKDAVQINVYTLAKKLAEIPLYKEYKEQCAKFNAICKELSKLNG